MSKKSQIRTRIAPSPTGSDIHLGNLYTAVLSYAWAKKNKGQFIVRIEDTDQARKVDGSAEKILQTLESYNIVPTESPKVGGDFGPYTQSKRLNIYQKYAKQLVESKHAYYCTCSKDRLTKLREKQSKNKLPPKYDKYCLNRQNNVAEEIKKGAPYVVRLNVEPNKTVVVNDLLRGEVKFNTNDIDDQVLLKSDGFPTYHLAVVVDDSLMKISHVIRAEDWLPSAPKHVLLYNALGFTLPVFAHTPLLRNADKSKLSKRKNPVWASWYLEQGYLPEAVVNYLSLMGWSHPGQKEKFTFEEFIEVFDIKNIDTAGPIFDLQKLEWLNGQYIKDLSNEEFYSKAISSDSELKELNQKKLKAVLPLLKERVRKFSEISDLLEYFFKAPQNFKEINEMANKESKLSTLGTKDQMKGILQVLEKIEDWNEKTIDHMLHGYMEKSSIKPRQFFMPIRIIVSGKPATPPLGAVLEIIGKQETINRINTFLNS
jgi:glutamyl-tRNA synthetase